MMDDIHTTIIDMSYPYFKNHSVSPREIRQYIERMKKAYPNENLDEDSLFRKLEAAHTVVIGDADVLDDSSDHLDWFNASTGSGLKREIAWHYWKHYRDYLSTMKKWPRSVVQSLDSLSNQIIARIEDPTRSGYWDRRGVVMGSVQSGKTANYTAVMTKAADAGYKLIVVLAGTHDSLRSQTQTRINEEFLGYDQEKVQRVTGFEKRIGVWKMFDDHIPVPSLTSSSQKGDFRKNVASTLGIFPRMDQPPIVLVIKKNVSILRNLILWISSIISQTDSEGNRIIRDIPLLVIDDECDFASINTKATKRENGHVSDDDDPTATNRNIRQLLKMFEKSAYIGYTATPYANIFIHKDDVHNRFGDDLFPRSFIISLPQPSNYLGPERLFGLDADPDRRIDEIAPLPLIRYVEDQVENIPDGHRKDLLISELPESMKLAIRYFILSCAARHLRGDGTPHNSMLIHVTMFTDVQKQIKRLVDNELAIQVARIMSNDPLDDYRKIWEEEYFPTSRAMMNLGFGESAFHSWEDIERAMGLVSRVISVKEINGTVRDSLEYKDAEATAVSRIRAGETVPREEMGLSVIAIGGNKLSRGLTLEGLTISYYLRASAMYDTLLQMGRWFGYKEGYTDLCRIFTTDEIASWYRYIAMATLELRNEIEYMSALNLQPIDFGLKVRSHPGRLTVTSLSKARNKLEVKLSFNNRISETIVFDPRQSINNFTALVNLIGYIGRKTDVEYTTCLRYHWKNVPADLVIDFLNAYRTQDQFMRFVDPKAMAIYIERMNKRNELTRWDVVLVSNLPGKGQHTVRVGEFEVHTQERTTNNVITVDKIPIQRLVSPGDEMADLSDAEIESAIRYARNLPARREGDLTRPPGPAIRYIRPKERGLLLVYMIEGSEKDKPERRYGGPGEEVVAFAISFPNSPNAETIDYWVNPVYQEEEEHYI